MISVRDLGIGGSRSRYDRGSSLESNSRTKDESRHVYPLVPTYLPCDFEVNYSYLIYPDLCKDLQDPLRHGLPMDFEESSHTVWHLSRCNHKYVTCTLESYKRLSHESNNSCLRTVTQMTERVGEMSVVSNVLISKSRNIFFSATMDSDVNEIAFSLCS